MTEQLFLTYEEFAESVVQKRKGCVAMDDISLLTFTGILYDSLADEYIVKVKLKDEFRGNYKHRTELVMLENTHLIHWAEWLDIGIMIKRHPELRDSMFLVTRVAISLVEPCFIDQPAEYRIKILAERNKKTKHEFTFLHRIKDWTVITVEYVLMERQIDVLGYYHKKHVARNV